MRAGIIIAFAAVLDYTNAIKFAWSTEIFDWYRGTPITQA